MHFTMAAQDRVLGAAIGLSLALHFVLLSMHFHFPDGKRWKQDSAPLEVVLVNAKTRERPGKADVLASCEIYTADPGCFRDTLRNIDGATPEQVREVARGRVPEEARVAEGRQPAGGERRRRVRVEQRHGPFQERRFEQVVRVEARHVLPGCFLDPEVARPRETLVFRPEDPGLRPDVRREEISSDRIGRAVVDQDDLEIPVRLIEDALDGLVHVRAEVVAGNDDRDRRLRTRPLRFAASAGLHRRILSADGMSRDRTGSTALSGGADLGPLDRWIREELPDAGSFKGVGYLNEYVKVLGPRLPRMSFVVELGVAEGASLLAWARLCPRARCLGIDRNPSPTFTSTLERLDLADRVSVLECDHNDVDTIDAAIEGAPDLIVDDGSHLLEPARRCFLIFQRPTRATSPTASSYSEIRALHCRSFSSNSRIAASRASFSDPRSSRSAARSALSICFSLNSIWSSGLALVRARSEID